MKRLYFAVLSIMAIGGFVFPSVVEAQNEDTEITLEECQQSFSEKGYPRRCDELTKDYIHWIANHGIVMTRHPQWDNIPLQLQNLQEPFMHFVIKEEDAHFIGMETPSAKRRLTFEEVTEMAKQGLMQSSPTWKTLNQGPVLKDASRGIYIEGTYTHNQKQEKYFMRQYYFQVSKDNFYRFYRFIFYAPEKEYKTALEQVELMLKVSSFTNFD